MNYSIKGKILQIMEKEIYILESCIKSTIYYYKYLRKGKSRVGGSGLWIHTSGLVLATTIPSFTRHCLFCSPLRLQFLKNVLFKLFPKAYILRRKKSARQKRPYDQKIQIIFQNHISRNNLTLSQGQFLHIEILLFTWSFSYWTIKLLNYNL